MPGPLPAEERGIRGEAADAAPRPAGGQRWGHRGGLGRTGVPPPRSFQRPAAAAPSRGCEGMEAPSAGLAAEPLPGARHNPQKVAARRKSRILPEPRPPGWRAVAKGHQQQRCSGGAAHLCRFPAAPAASGAAPRERRRSPPCPAPRRAPASPELSAETGRNCRRSES